MSLLYHPQQGSLVMVTFEPGFLEPEMTKRRLCIVLSSPIKERAKLITIVALSTSPPRPVLPFHAEIEIPFDLPNGWRRRCWVKGDMVNAVGFHRSDLVKLGKDDRGNRIYQTECLPDETLQTIKNCVMFGLNLRS